VDCVFCEVSSGFYAHTYFWQIWVLKHSCIKHGSVKPVRPTKRPSFPPPPPQKQSVNNVSLTSPRLYGVSTLQQYFCLQKVSHNKLRYVLNVSRNTSSPPSSSNLFLRWREVTVIITYASINWKQILNFAIIIVWPSISLSLLMQPSFWRIWTFPIL
jgi:hypothetical protein